MLPKTWEEYINILFDFFALELIGQSFLSMAQ